MIMSAEQFVYLRNSEERDEYNQAANDEAPLEVWLDVVARFPNMQWWVVHNKTVPLQILEMLSTSADWDVRSAVARKRKLSYELFDALSKDESDAVRRGIACNAKTPSPILQRLTEDPYEDIAQTARERLRQR